MFLTQCKYFKLDPNRMEKSKTNFNYFDIYGKFYAE